MKATSAYKITGILAALTLATAFGANAQDAQTTEPAAPPVVAPVTPATPTTPDTSTTPPETVPNTATTPDTGATPQPEAPAVADATPETTILAPKDFMQQAFLANEFGIAAGQLALQQAESADTKDAAQQVLNDGLKVRTDMVAAIQGSSADMHFDQAWTDEYKQKLADLQAKKGAEFDSQYLATQGEITNHSTDLYSQFASTAPDDSVKTFAANTLPTLQAEGDKLESVSMGGQ